MIFKSELGNHFVGGTIINEEAIDMVENQPITLVVSVLGSTVEHQII